MYFQFAKKWAFLPAALLLFSAQSHAQRYRSVVFTPYAIWAETSARDLPGEPNYSVNLGGFGVGLAYSPIRSFGVEARNLFMADLDIIDDGDREFNVETWDLSVFGRYQASEIIFFRARLGYTQWDVQGNTDKEKIQARSTGFDGSTRFDIDGQNYFGGLGVGFGRGGVFDVSIDIERMYDERFDFTRALVGFNIRF